MLPSASPRSSRFVVVSTELDNGCQYFRTLREVLEFVERTSKLFWLNVEGITDQEMKVLGDAFTLNEVSQKDCINEDTAISDEKWESFEQYLFVIADILRNDGDQSRQSERPQRAGSFTVGSPIKREDVAGRLAGAKLEQDLLASRKWHTENINCIVFKRCVLSLHNNRIGDRGAGRLAELLECKGVFDRSCKSVFVNDKGEVAKSRQGPWFAVKLNLKEEPETLMNQMKGRMQQNIQKMGNLGMMAMGGTRRSILKMQEGEHAIQNTVSFFELF